MHENLTQNFKRALTTLYSTKMLNIIQLQITSIKLKIFINDKKVFLISLEFQASTWNGYQSLWSREIDIGNFNQVKFCNINILMS